MEPSTLSLYLSLVALTIALVVGSPTLARFVLYFFYHPSIKVFWADQQRANMGELIDSVQASLNVQNRTKREFEFTIELQTSAAVTARPLALSPSSPSLIGGTGTFRFRWWTNVRQLPGLAGAGIRFPFKAHSSDYQLQIVLHLKLRMTEVKLPTFFGDVDLKPIRKTFTVVPNQREATLP